ncbi:hypothetical protein GCM10011494_38550 [Novosphingobium endophyticum]|uniref:HTH tetR-type domain-containing protein n=1 Tax=Novosphingobium endophyticum TaxID=1955250 RepID=A0A916TVP9_9SPHN|nr:TetR/AcrR family transcriptional regulator [Novosphingobium endophyticum]GGC15945.1 hypothetical protein GCM10011494_38550 [Novosphingobium endophyticum]
MTSKPKKEPAKRTRRAPGEIRKLFLDAAAHEFETYGYRGATTAAIAQRAGATEAQLFRYFQSKNDLFRAAIFEPLNTHFCDFMASTLDVDDNAKSLREREQAYITELQRFMREHSRHLMSLIVAETHGARDLDGFSAIPGLEEYFARGAAMMRSRYQGEPPIAPELLVRVSFAAVMANVLFKDWLFPEGMASDAAIASAIIDFTIDGLSSGPPPPGDGIE